MTETSESEITKSFIKVIDRVLWTAKATDFNKKALAEAITEVAQKVIDEAAKREREACALIVFGIRKEATDEDAPDEGVSGWLKIAEDAIRSRSSE